MWEEAEVLKAVPDAGCVGRLGFSWQSQTLVVRGRDVGSHGSPRRWLWGGGEARVLMAVPDAGYWGTVGGSNAVTEAGFGGRGGGSHTSPRCRLWGRRVGGSHGSYRRWLQGGEAEVLMAILDPGCGREGRGSSSYVSPNH